MQPVLTNENNVPADNEQLLLELVNAKTAEAVARQELEEMRARFEGLKRTMNGQPPVSVAASPAGTPVQTPAAVLESKKDGAAAGGWTWGGWKRTVSTSNVNIS
jgi:hypothetical protein